MATGTMYQGMRRKRDELDTEGTDAAIKAGLNKIKNYSSLTGKDFDAPAQSGEAPALKSDLARLSLRDNPQEVGVAPEAKKPKKNSLGMAEANAAEVPEVKEPEMALGHAQNVPGSMRQIAGADPMTGKAVKDVTQPTAATNPATMDPVQRTPAGASMQQADGGYGTITGDADAIKAEANNPRNYDPNTGKRLPPGVTPNMAYGRLQNAGGSLRVGNMDVSFDKSVGMEQRQAFLQDPVRPTAQIDRGPRPAGLMGDAMPAAPQGSSLPEMPTLFTKETHPNMRFDEMERLNAELIRGWNAEKTAVVSGTLRNEGGANVANISTQGDLAEQQLRNEGVLGAAMVRGGDGDEWKMETVNGGTDSKGRRLPDQAFMVSKDGRKVPVNTKYKFLSPEFNPHNLSEQDAGMLKQLETSNPEMLDEILQEYGLAPKEKKGLLAKIAGYFK